MTVYNTRVEDLKQQWLKDPCWDIETTEGFEEFYQELLAFRLATESNWAERKKKRQLERAAQLGVPGCIALVEYIETLEARIVALEKSIVCFVREG